jgi:CheY-like chemotaxis protein
VAKILIVEDDEMLMDLMQQTLELSDHTTRGAVNGADALTKAELDKPDLILMDIGMPLMDGYEATRRLKASPRTRDVPVIALTAHASPADRQQALDAGADDYEPKPVEFDRLLEKIQTLLNRAAK